MYYHVVLLRISGYPLSPHLLSSLLIRFQLPDRWLGHTHLCSRHLPGRLVGWISNEGVFCITSSLIPQKKSTLYSRFDVLSLVYVREFS